MSGGNWAQFSRHCLRAIALMAIATDAIAKGEVARMQVSLPRIDNDTGSEIVGTLSVTNAGQSKIVIITPLLPTTWHVDWTPSDPGQGRVKSAWDGSVLQGTPDPGFAKAYAPTDYVAVSPASTHERAIDIGWYLRNQRESIPPGVYKIKFWYHCEDNGAGGGLRASALALESNELEVRIADRQGPGTP